MVPSDERTGAGSCTGRMVTRSVRVRDAPVVNDADNARLRVAGLEWWHRIEVAPGVLTPGGWDLRGTASRLPWPPSIAGLRCLDVGTMDGFWAFELERRGAGEVVASDVLDATRLDHFVADRLRGERFRRSSELNFGLAAELLSSRIELLDLSVYDLDPAEVRPRGDGLCVADAA